jgi:hypothetical protein
MSRLAQLQRNFISDCLSGKLTKDNTLMAKDIDSRVISAQGLMGIYQHSAIANITYSLSLTYPVIEKLVGKAFFQATCKEFIRVIWPKSGNMDDYGVEFADFLAQFEHAKHLTYLQDVARLEWAFHQSSLADEASITDWSTLAQVSDILQLCFILAPSVNLLTSIYPIEQIWQSNQSDIPSAAELDLSVVNDNGEYKSKYVYLLVFRQGLKTLILSISQGEFTLLQAIFEKQNFEQAIIKATEQQADISIDNSLKKFIELGVISGFISPS